MIFGIAFRLVPVAIGLAGAGIYWLYRYWKSDTGESTSHLPKDEFIPNPPKLDPKMMGKQMMGKQMGSSQKRPWINPTQGRFPPSTSSTSGEQPKDKEKTGGKQNGVADDNKFPRPANQSPEGNLESIPEFSVSRGVNTFDIEETYYTDGSLSVGICDGAMQLVDNICYGVRVVIEPDQVEWYLENRDNVRNSCYSMPDGGLACYDILVGPQITFLNYFDSVGDQMGGEVEEGMFFPGEEYLYRKYTGWTAGIK